jgi:hypothetical protein
MNSLLLWISHLREKRLLCKCLKLIILYMLTLSSTSCNRKVIKWDIKIMVQWKPFNVVNDNVIIWLMCWNWPSLTVPNSYHLSTYLLMSGNFAYCRHSVYSISFSLSMPPPLFLLFLWFEIVGWFGFSPFF